MEVDLEGVPLERQVMMGKNVESLLEHDGFAALTEVLGLHAEGIHTQAIYSAPSTDVARHADRLGHERGLREIEAIALGIVENGKQAAGELATASDKEGNT